MFLLRRVAILIANHEFWLLWVYGAPLLFARNLPLAVFAAALATIPCFWLARGLARGKWTIATPLDLPLALLLVTGLVGVAVSSDIALSLRVFGELVGGVALYYSVVNGLPTTRLSIGVWFLVLLGAAMGLVGWLGMQYSAKFLPIAFMYDYMPHLDFPFLNSSGFTPNLVAGAVAPVFLVAFAWAWSQSRWKRHLLLALALFFFGVVVLTQSRGAILGILLACAILFCWRIPRLTWLVAIVGALVIVAIVWLGPPNVAEFLFVSDSTSTAASRLELWNRALYIWQDFPFTGIGLGTFAQVVPVLYPLFLNDPSLPIPHAHNIYLQMGVDYGLPGFVAFVGLVTTTMCVALSNVLRTRGTRAGWLAIGLLAGYSVYLVHGLLDAVTTNSKDAVILWFLVGLMMVLSRAVEERRAFPA